MRVYHYPSHISFTRIGSVDVTCRRCENVHHVTVSNADLDRWRAGVHIQDAIPYLTADKRELLISGICPVCWDDMFGDEDDDL